MPDPVLLTALSVFAVVSLLASLAVVARTFLDR